MEAHLIWPRSRKMPKNVPQAEASWWINASKHKRKQVKVLKSQKSHKSLLEYQ